MKHPLTPALALFVVFGLLSCNKLHQDIPSIAAIPFHFHNYYEAAADGTIYLRNRQANFGVDPGKAGNTFIRTTSNELSQLLVSDSLTLGQGVVLNLRNESNGAVFKPDSSYEKLFGANIDVGLFGAATATADSAFYVPEIIHLRTEEYPLELAGNYPISWNADASNREGVYVIVEYSRALNEKLSNKYPKRILNYVHLPDNGSATLSRQDFPDIPPGAVVILSIIRGSGGRFSVETAAGKSSLEVVATSEVSGFANFFTR